MVCDIIRLIISSLYCCCGLRGDMFVKKIYVYLFDY